ncbi:hypothetical protein A3Q56_03720, partial [Intoshia linei]
PIHNLAKYINFVDSYGTFALMEAVVRSNQKLTKILLNYGAEVNQRSTIYKNVTPLQYCICAGFYGILKLLILFGAYIDMTVWSECSSLVYAIKSFDRKCLKIMLKYCTDRSFIHNDCSNVEKRIYTLYQEKELDIDNILKIKCFNLPHKKITYI